jgi:hypothetical protein
MDELEGHLEEAVEAMPFDAEVDAIGTVLEEDPEAVEVAPFEDELASLPLSDGARRERSSSGERDPRCQPYHYWLPDWSQHERGQDGVERHLYRCANCGLELMATSIDEATALAQDLDVRQGQEA